MGGSKHLHPMRSLSAVRGTGDYSEGGAGLGKGK